MCVCIWQALSIQALQRWGHHKACWDFLSLQSLYREGLPHTNTHMHISVFFPKYITHVFFPIFVFNIVLFLNYKVIAILWGIDANTYLADKECVKLIN